MQQNDSFEERNRHRSLVFNGVDEVADMNEREQRAAEWISAHPWVS